MDPFVISFIFLTQYGLKHAVADLVSSSVEKISVTSLFINIRDVPFICLILFGNQ